jgi:hypothetical protein
MNRRRETAAHVGSASILLIFTVLSLISFAALATASSKADYNLSRNLAIRQYTYYSACHKGNAFVAAVSSGYSEGAENGIIEENIPITDNQSLVITLMSNSINNLSNSYNSPQIKRWQIVNYEANDYDYTLPVYKEH